MNIFETVDITNINFHYWDRYKNFIKNIQNKGRRKLQYKERHHIIPKCINKMQGGDELAAKLYDALKDYE